MKRNILLRFYGISHACANSGAQAVFSLPRKKRPGNEANYERDRDRARRTVANDKMALYYTEIAAKTWISLSKGTKLLLYRKDHARSKLRAFHVKIIVCRPLNLAVGRLLKKKKKKKEKTAVWPISV